MRAKLLTSSLRGGWNVLALASLVVVGIATTGCGAGPQAIDTSTLQADNDKAVRARAIFDGVGGDWSKVSATDKAELTKLYGSAANAEKVWQLMLNPPGAPTAPSAPAPGAPPVGR